MSPEPQKVDTSNTTYHQATSITEDDLSWDDVCEICKSGCIRLVNSRRPYIPRRLNTVLNQLQGRPQFNCISTGYRLNLLTDFTVEAVQAHEYMGRFYNSPDDPFTVSSERVHDDIYLKSAITFHGNEAADIALVETAIPTGPWEDRHKQSAKSIANTE